MSLQSQPKSSLTLDKCKKNKPYIITSIALNDNSTKARFASLGISKGMCFRLLYTSLKDATLSIQINQSLIALRNDEAMFIGVQAL